MSSHAWKPVRLSAEFWQRDDVVAALDACDIGALFRLIQQYTGASQDRIGTSVGMSQPEVNKIMRSGPRQRQVTTHKLLARIANGLDIPDQGRKHLGLAPQHDSPDEDQSTQHMASRQSIPGTNVETHHENETEEIPWETADLIERIQASDVSPQTLERLEASVFELCCEYPYQDAGKLHRDAQGWLSRVDRLLRRPVGLHQHKELLVSAGWLALLIGCLEYDQGMRSAAESTRVAARQIGDDAGNSEIVAWSHEMSAWFALTQGRYGDVVAAAEAGQSSDGVHSVQVQLLAQEAKALGRMGDIDGVRSALDRGAQILSSIPRPDRTEHHFIVDPDKWQFYAMDAYRLARKDELAQGYAREVLAKGTNPDGTERAPMRMAEARLTLGVVAARSGELEEAMTHSLQSLESARRSLPTLLMVAGEFDSTLREQFPGEGRTTAEFRDKLRAEVLSHDRKPI